jgi:nicotinate-nucleotide adenylyltransferase
MPAPRGGVRVSGKYGGGVGFRRIFGAVMEIKTIIEIADSLKLFYPHKKVGILGGTFNPLHNGHVDMAYNVKEEFELDSVILLPAGAPPHKMDVETAPSEARLRMVVLCALETDWLKVSDMEVKRCGPSYTVDTMRELGRKYKDTDFYFVIGSDSLFELETWKNASELFRLTRFICVRRREHDRLAVAAEAARLSEKYGAVIMLSRYDGLNISSSEVRRG